MGFVSRWMARLGVVALMTTVAIGLVVPVAIGHSGQEAYVYLEVYDDGTEGRVEYPVADLGDILGIEIPQDGDGAKAAVEANFDQIVAYSEDHLELGRNGSAWQIDYGDEFSILTPSGGTYVIVPFEIDEDFAEMPRTFEVEFDGIIESKPDKSALFIIATDWRSGTFKNEAEHLLVFTADETFHDVDLGDTDVVDAVVGVVGLGVEHIQIGSDHILFILALLLPAVLIFYPRLGWRPTETFGSGLWRVVKIATSFTIAHTITLTLGGLGVITISPDIVEPIIAISIALAALHNLRPVFFNKEWLLAFGFGLFHGFGFAGLLADLGLDRSNRVLSLLGFNIGIEIGQVAIILLLFPALFLLRRTLFYVTFMQVGSIALIAIALGWFVDRVFELDLGVDEIVNPVLAWPRALWLVAVFTVISWGVYEIEKRRGRLIPIDVPLEEEESSVPAAG